MRLSAAPPPWADAEPDPSPVDPDWFVLLEGKQVGPLDARALVERVRSGEVHGRTFVWRDGFDGWRRSLEVPELLPVLEEAGFPATPPHGPITPADWRSPPRGRSPPRSSTPPAAQAQASEIAARRPPGQGRAPVQPSAEEELELADRPRRRRSSVPPESDFVRSGLHRRSPWKLALALSAALALPVGGLALFVSLRRDPVIVEPRAEPDSLQAPTPTPEPSAPVRKVQELRDLLLGKRAHAPAPPAKKPAPPEAKPAPPPPKPAPDGPKTAELRALYGEQRKADVGPRVRRPEASAAGTARGSGGPTNEEVARVVGQTQAAFQSCIEHQLRKNPGFRGGKVNLVATVGTSGTVKQVALDRRDLEGTDLGDCLRSRARRMVFSAFAGDDVDVEIPLVLTTTL